jgi:hypothetical protein
MTPMLEAVLSRVTGDRRVSKPQAAELFPIFPEPAESHFLKKPPGLLQKSS